MKTQLPTMNKHLPIIGFMGAGKSTVAAATAERLKVPVYDTDIWIVTRTGKTPRQIMDGPGGEEEFRAFELSALESIFRLPPGLVPTGGGIITTPDARKALKNCGAPIVYLSLDFGTTLKRVRADKENDRPLFDDEAAALARYDTRDPWYHEVATDIVDASQPIDAVVEDVLRCVR